MSNVFEFNYTGSPEQISLIPGSYVLEVWGAQGGNGPSNTTANVIPYGGKGGYAKGTFNTRFTSAELQILVGGQNGYNGGGSGAYYYTNAEVGGCGGGATDIRYKGTALTNRIIVAGGGGGGFVGTSSTYCNNGGSGGGTSGGNGGGYEYYSYIYPGKGATQTSGYALGRGQNASGAGAGGGGGYYGGTSSVNRSSSTNSIGCYGAGGGSGFVSPIYLTQTQMSNGARSGDGFARITMLYPFAHDIKLSRNQLVFTKFDSFDQQVSKIEFSINDNIVDTIETPDDNFNYDIDNNDCLFGLNNIQVTTTLMLDDESEVTFNDYFQYVRYGEPIQGDVSISEFNLYLESLGNQVVDLRNLIAGILSNQGIDVSGINKITDLIKLIDQLTNNNNSEITEYITRITELEAQIHDLNEELKNKVTPAGTATAGDVLTGKTFINSTGNVITGSYVKPPEANILYPGSTNWFNKSGSVNLNSYTNSSPWNNGAYFNVDCGSAPKTGWYKMTLSMAEGLDMTGQYRIISGSIAIFGPTSTQYNGKYNNFTRDFYFYLYKGMPLSLNISGYSSLWNEYSGGCSYSFVCNYIG